MAFSWLKLAREFRIYDLYFRLPTLTLIKNYQIGIIFTSEAKRAQFLLLLHKWAFIWLNMLATLAMF